jgi:hypothetical protein
MNLLWGWEEKGNLYMVKRILPKSQTPVTEKPAASYPKTQERRSAPFFKLLHCLHSFNDQFCRYKSVPLSSRLAIEK